MNNNSLKLGNPCTHIGGVMDYEQTNQYLWTTCSAEDFQSYYDGITLNGSAPFCLQAEPLIAPLIHPTETTSTTTATTTATTSTITITTTSTPAAQTSTKIPTTNTITTNNTYTLTTASTIRFNFFHYCKLGYKASFLCSINTGTCVATGLLLSSHPQSVMNGYLCINSITCLSSEALKYSLF